MKTRTLRIVLGMTVAGLATTFCHAQSLDGRRITVEGTDHLVVSPVVALPLEGAKPTGRYIVTEDKTAKKYPLTVADGFVYFIPDGSMPKTSHVYEVSADKSEPAKPRVRLEKKGADAIDVYIEDELFTTYHYSNENKKPFLWPLNSAGGVKITRDFPMGAKEKTDDHPHHKSFWSAYGNVNGADCWAEEKPKEGKPNSGSGFQHSGEVSSESGDVFGVIRAKNEWQDRDHKPVLEESREYRFYACPADRRLFDVTVTLKAAHGDVKFGDTKEGGIVALRMRDDLTLNNNPESHITLSTGVKDKEAWGKPAAWCDYSGPVAGQGVRGITVFDNAANLRFPTTWHVRDYGLMGANPFGLAAFTEKDPVKKNGDYTLKAGESMVFKYRVLVHVGDVEKAAVADRYSEYATPVKASWAK